MANKDPLSTDTLSFDKKFIGKIKNSRHRIPLIILIVLLILGGGLFVYTSLSSPQHKVQEQALAVMVTSVQKGDMDVYFNTIGTITPMDSLTVKTQLNGRLISVRFKEGQFVKKGDILAEIDASPYLAQLKQYEGQLVRDQALLENTILDLKRAQVLHQKGGFVSTQTLDTQRSLVKQYEGTVKFDQGLLESAKVNLDYCHIKTTISGKIGLRQVNPGNFVQPTDTVPIAIVNSITPIAVLFSIPEDQLAQVQKRLSQGRTLVIEAFDKKYEHPLATGKVFALDSQIDTTTGTIRIKGIFDNQDQQLFPNQFVNVRLKIDTLHDLFLIPTAAIQHSRQGSFVYVVNDKSKRVSLKSVVLQNTDSELSAVTGDLLKGQTIVVQGMDRLLDGSLITPTSTLENHVSKRSLTP